MICESLLCGSRRRLISSNTGLNTKGVTFDDAIMANILWGKKRTVEMSDPDRLARTEFPNTEPKMKHGLANQVNGEITYRKN